YGPIVGAIAAGVGTAAADLAGGYFQWAAISFLVHGVQGYLVGKLAQMDSLKALAQRLWYIIGAASVVVVVVGYFLGGIILVGVGGAVSEVGFNTAQAAIGSLLGILLYLAIKKAYPQISKL
ncbi:MAG: ECF transporter S component, partial [Chloroflexota bacterium]